MPRLNLQLVKEAVEKLDRLVEESGAAGRGAVIQAMIGQIAKVRLSILPERERLVHSPCMFPGCLEESTWYTFEGAHWCDWHVPHDEANMPLPVFLHVDLRNVEVEKDGQNRPG